jgi:quercetin dioxygenase-like cupin family protein
MRLPKVTSDGNGGSRFEELDVPQIETPFADNVPALLVSEAIAATGVVFVTMPDEVRRTEPHPAPRRQLVLIVDGEFEIETTDGEKRRLVPGNAALLEDVEGRGHTTTVRSSGPATFIAIPLANDSAATSGGAAAAHG